MSRRVLRRRGRCMGQCNWKEMEGREQEDGFEEEEGRDEAAKRVEGRCAATKRQTASDFVSGWERADQ